MAADVVEAAAGLYRSPEQPFGETGLAYWMGVMGRSAAVPAQADFVNNIVLPHFYLFAPIVYGLEVLTAFSLLIGIFVRLRTYFFLLVLMLIFAVHRYGRSLGLDAIIVARWRSRSILGRIFLATTT